jgi:hypothetical protein
MAIEMSGSRSLLAENRSMARTPSKASVSRIIQLDAKNEGGLVTVTPRDQDRFNLRVSEAIQACQVAEEHRQAYARFQFLLKRLGRWVLTRPDLRAAFVTTRDRGFAFIAIHDTPEYDASFEDSLADLDLELARDPDIKLSVEVLSLPPVSEEAMQSFLNSDFTLRFSGGKG